MIAKDIALGGILSALTLIILYLTYLLPTNTLTLLTLAAFMVPVALIRRNLRTALAVYVTTTVLCMLFLPPNIFIMYSLFFGCYGIVKYFIELLDRPIVEWILKFIFFNLIFFIGVQTFMTFISPHLLDQINQLTSEWLPNIPFAGAALLWCIAQVAFFIFDYALTLLIDLYYKYFPYQAHHK